MDTPIRVVQFGLGPIGLECVRTLLKKEASGKVKLVGAIDTDPAKVGKDMADLLDLPEPTLILVSSDAPGTLHICRPDVVLHTTSSFLEKVKDQLVTCIEAGVHVVSSTEELFYPLEEHSDLSQHLNRLAEEKQVVLLGTGVNPGYAMDTLVLAATSVCTEITGIRVKRVVDAGKRRLPLQKKVGAGLTIEEFTEMKKSGTFGHIGLRESLLFVADRLGWNLDAIEEDLEPVIASSDIRTPFLTVKEGTVAGIHHSIKGIKESRSVLSLDLQMFTGADDPYDSVKVEGKPTIDLVVRGGIFGDTATVAMLVNMIPLVAAARPGLRTMSDMPVPRAFASNF